MRETQQCQICKHYSLYHMPQAGKTICATCQESERAKIVNAGVKRAK